jgi:hypothetical protein
MYFLCVVVRLRVDASRDPKASPRSLHLFIVQVAEAKDVSSSD